MIIILYPVLCSLLELAKEAHNIPVHKQSVWWCNVTSSLLLFVVIMALIFRRYGQYRRTLGPIITVCNKMKRNSFGQLGLWAPSS
jgi:hypothetical protein